MGGYLWDDFFESFGSVNPARGAAARGGCLLSPAVGSAGLRVLANAWFLFTVIASQQSSLEGQPFAGLPLNDPVHSITVSAAPLAGSIDAWL